MMKPMKEQIGVMGYSNSSAVIINGVLVILCKREKSYYLSPLLLLEYSKSNGLRICLTTSLSTRQCW